MSHHVPTIQSGEKYKLPNQPFISWLKNHTALVISQLFGGLGFIYFLAALIYYMTSSREHVPEFFTLNFIQKFIDYAHLMCLVIFITVLLWVRDDNDQGSYRVGMAYRVVFTEELSSSRIESLLESSKLQLRKFKLYFLLFWFGMLALYIVFVLKHSLTKEAVPLASPTKEWIALISYFFPSSPPITEWGGAIIYLGFPFSTFLFNNLTLLFAFWCFVVLYLPSIDIEFQKRRHNFLISFSGFIVCLFTALFPLLLFLSRSDNGEFNLDDLNNYAAVFDGISGLLNAVVLALLIARLDSKFIGLPSWLISVLYIYSAVQPLFVVFELSGVLFAAIQTFVLFIVFIFKIYFFLIITYTLQTGRMLNYLFCFPFLNERVNSIFDNQFEIKIKDEKEAGFGLTILNDGAEVYSTDIKSETREDCDKRVVKLREATKHELSYNPKESCGTHWVEIIESDPGAVCHSRDLKSKKEAEDLIKESMKKIPYCKYSRN